MKKRIGNDITFTWHIYRKSGDTQVPESFTGKDVEVKLISPLQRTVTIEDVTIATGVVTFTFRGKHQVTLGNYVAVLQENRGEDGMVTLDVVDAVTLVPHSYMEEDGDEGDVIEAESVELESSISAGGGGVSVDAYTKAESDELFVKKIFDEPGVGTTYFSPTGMSSLANDEHGMRNSSYNALGWSVYDGTDNIQTFRGTIYKGGIGTINSTRVIWEKTATSQIPAATTEENGLMSAEDKGKLNDLPTATELTQELAGKANTADLAEVATSGSYNDLSDKPTIPAAQVQSDWNEGDTTSKAYIKNKPTIPTVPTNVSALNNDAGYITASDVADKQDKMPIIQVASGITAINAAVNTYYEVAGEVGTLAITLPTPTDLTKVLMVVAHLTVGASPNIVIGSAATVDYSAAYEVKANKEYEINCSFNGDKWVVADMEVV